jgi:hypothetical protein
MSHIFYFVGLLIFLMNFFYLFDYFEFIRIKEWLWSYKKVTLKDPSESDFKRGDAEKYRKFNGIIILNFLWIFFGLLTGSWKFFGIILILNLIVNLIQRLIGSFRFISKILQFLIFNITCGMEILLVINHFHLHLDLFSLLVGLLF